MKVGEENAWAAFLRQDLWFVRGLSSILALRVVEKLTGFVLTLFLFRMMGKEQVADYGFIQTVVAICAVFGIKEFQNTISQSVARGYHGVYRQAVPLAFKWSLLGTAILGGFGAWYFCSGKAQLGLGFLIAAGLFPAFSALGQWKGVYLGKKDFSRFATAEASNAILKALLIIAALYAFSGAIIVPALVFFAVPAAQNIRQTLLCHQSIPKQAIVEEGAIAYGLNSNLYAGISTVANQIDRILIFTLLSPPLLAIFMAAEKFPELLQGVEQDIGAVLAPKFSNMTRYTPRLDNTLWLGSLVMGVFIILFAIFGLPSLVILVFGQNYHESVVYAQLLVGALAVRNVSSLRFRFIRSKLDANSYRNVLIIGSAAKIVASVTLIPLFGLGGAVASVFIHRLTISAVVGNAIRTMYLKKC